MGEDTKHKAFLYELCCFLVVLVVQVVVGVFFIGSGACHYCVTCFMKLQ